MPLDLAVLERADRAGGPLRTVRRDGFVMETGADSFLTEKPWAADLARRLGLEDQLIPTRPEFRRTMVVRRGRLVEIPAGFSLLGPARLMPLLKSPLFSPAAKLRIACERIIPKRDSDADESLASFVTRRLGRQVLERIAQPLAGGIYTADPARLSMAATMPRFLEMERRWGSVYLGMRAAERERAAENTSGARWSLFLSLRDGVSALVDALTARLGDSLRTECGAQSVAPGLNRWRVVLSGGVKFLDADAVIIATAARCASDLLFSVQQHVSRQLRKIAYASAATVNLTFRESDFPAPLSCVGFVVPAAERRAIIAASFSSLKFENRAPAGAVLARAFLGGVLQSAMMQLSDDEMVGVVREEFRQLLGVTAEPGMVEVQRWPDAMAQYDVGHLDLVSDIEQTAAQIPLLALAGAAYRGVGIPDAIHSGEQAAENIFAQLAARA
jgi:protoporphyrinogen/coproporphyrinogen III oxidase